MSDYIERLRGELLRAGATQPRRVRVPSFKPVLALVAAAAIVAVVVIALPQRSEEREAAGSTTTYRVEGDVEATASVLRERMRALGVVGAITTTGDTLTIPADARALAVPGELTVYDWERSLIGDDEPVGAHQAETRGGLAVRSEDGRGWFSLRGEPALTNAAVASAAVATDPLSEPVVIVQLTARGQEAFHALTRTIAQRGAPGDLQHLAIVVDGQVHSIPYVDARYAPDGIDGSEGLQISGGFTRWEAEELAAVLDSGPLPGKLTAN